MRVFVRNGGVENGGRLDADRVRRLCIVDRNAKSRESFFLPPLPFLLFEVVSLFV